MTTKANTLVARKLRQNPEYRERQAALRKRRRKNENATTTKWRNENPAKVLYTNAKHRAKRRNLEFSISIEDVLIPATCPVLGIPLFRGQGMGARTSPNSPSLDRFDNTKGYIPGNVRVISARANVLKSDATVEEMAAVLAYMKGELP